MNNHESRSMKTNHAAIVEKARLSFEWVSKHVFPVGSRNQNTAGAN
jgi:hypothetical protein